MDNNDNPVNSGLLGKVAKLATTGLKTLGVNILTSRTLKNRWEIGLGSRSIMTSDQ